MNKIAAILVLLSITASAQADPNLDALTRCLADSTTGKDRIDLARYYFAAMAQHPEVADVAAVPPEKLDLINQTAGKIYNRMFTDVCSKELRMAAQSGGEAATKSAYVVLTKLAIQELASNPNVMASFAGVFKYVDTKKIREITGAQ